MWKRFGTGPLKDGGAESSYTAKFLFLCCTMMSAIQAVPSEILALGPGWIAVMAFRAIPSSSIVFSCTSDIRDVGSGSQLLRE
ncbi:hypothetical protein Y032_1176g3731 [Ancylostoma ceylanicum]|nr:hypothetical protein Y032_1176g3731 [Ancylostoma ceylanicum]